MGYEDPTGAMYLGQRHGASGQRAAQPEKLVTVALSEPACSSGLSILGGVGWLVCLFSQGMVGVRFRASKC